MKSRFLIPLALALLGCSSTTPRSTVLTAGQAASLAQQLANEKAQELFHCQPFRAGTQASLDHGHWFWRELRGEGTGDLEATVEFAADGANADVNLTWLSNAAVVR